MEYEDYKNHKELSDMIPPDTPGGWIYVGDTYTRYLLGEPKKENILVFGINPSTATPLCLDPTIKKVRSICSHDIGNYGWIMANICPIRAVKPDELPHVFNKQLSDNNISILTCLLKTYCVKKIVAAWGNIIGIRDYMVEELLKISNALAGIPEYNDILWYHIGTFTKRGNPRHPLYLPKDSKLDPFYLFDYLDMNGCHLDE